MCFHVETKQRRVKVKVASDCLWPCGLYSPWNSPGQNTGVGSLSLLQGIFPTQGSNPGLLYCRQILYQLSYQGSREMPTKKMFKVRVVSQVLCVDKTRTVAQETASQIALRSCSKEAREGQYICDFGEEGSTCSQAHIFFCSRFQLVIRNRRHLKGV